MTERPREPRLITSEADILAELESLVALDDRLAMVVESAGSVPLRLRPGGLKGLCAIVTAQQVSKASSVPVNTGNGAGDRIARNPPPVQVAQHGSQFTGHATRQFVWADR